jgi:hypothetical protein
MNGPNDVHTDGNAIPPLDDELAGLLEDLADVHDAGVDQIISGLRLIALSRHSIDRTQTLVAVLAGGADGLNLVAAIGQVIARLANADTNPSLRTLPLHQQKTTQLNGETTAFVLAHPDLAQFASDTSAAIDGL